MLKLLKNHYDTFSLALAFVLLIAAIIQPSIQVDRHVHSFLIFVDVTQSMNVRDMTLAGNPTSRLGYAKQLLKQTIKKLPCNSRLGLGIFFKANAVLLYTPIETCSNYNILLATIDNLEWRMASHGSSNIRAGLQSISSTLESSGEPSQIVFITDGDEAAPLNVITKTDLSNWQGGSNWLIVGVGSNKPVPIPKLNTKNEIIGNWSTYSIKMEAATSFNEGPVGVRDESIANEPYEYYLSKLDETYLKEIAIDISGQYIKAGEPDALVKTMLNQKSELRYASAYELKWLFAFSALLLLLSTYLVNSNIEMPKQSQFANPRKPDL